MIVTLAGHVDHGKTALVKAITGVDTDRLEEEKRRGLTIDLGFAYHDFDGHRIGFVDVPGHHKFIHNMIAGIANMQHALLVVAANDGVMPQTREHLNILQLLGLTQGTIALTKIDVVDQSQVSHVTEQVRELVAGTFLDSSAILSTSSMTAQGISQLQAHLSDAAAQLNFENRQRSTRIAIDRSFSPRGIGTVVTGTVFDGKLQTGDELIISRSGKPVRSRSLVTNGIPGDHAQAGDRCGIQLSGETAANISRGDWLRAPTSTHKSQEFSLTLSVLADFPRSIRSWSPVHVYHATSHSLGRLLPLTDHLNPGENGLVDVVTNDAMDVVVGDRLIIRDADLQYTLGGGLVVDVEQPNIRRRHDQRINYLSKIAPFVLQEQPAKALLCEAMFKAVRLEDFLRKWNLSDASEVDLDNQKELRTLNGRYLAQESLRTIGRQVTKALTEHHSLHLDEFGASVNFIVDQCKLDRETAMFALACGIEDGTILLRSGKYFLPGHSVARPTYNQELYEQVLPFIDASQPSTTGDIAKGLKIPLRQLELEMKRMSQSKLFIQVTPKRYFTQSRLEELGQLATQLAQNKPFSVRDFRDASGIGRMPVIDVLEYFDRLRFTRRQEDLRSVVGSIDLIRKS
ncbi:MAG: selenocysteine-specific translation elongation factor [Gammaproteobacteria bacterium]|nr:selenocysteine-specific translation elongation factor [Gammaproteobacteria bacterium]MYD80071.1 selenocysteine-specific translation elongation factor [Gammaproteobacteria bacterium]